MEAKSTYNLIFLIRQARINKQGLTNVILRITLDGERIEINTKISVNPNLWDSDANKLKGRSKEALETNQLLDKIRLIINSHFNQLLETYDYVDLIKLKNAFLGIEERKHTILSLFDKKIDQKRALVGNGISNETLDKYVCTRAKVAEFISYYYKREDINIKEVGYDFITNYDIYLRSQYQCGHNTVVRHMRYLKQVTTDALKCHYIQIDPFNDFTLSSKRGDRKYLTEEELLSILNKKFVSRKLEEVRDVFIFCCFTGLAYVDVNRLRKHHITKNSKGEKVIIKERTKTGIQSYIPLLVNNT